MATNNANSRPISTYPIPASIQTKLNKAGFLTTGSVLNLRPSELSSSICIFNFYSKQFINLSVYIFS